MSKTVTIRLSVFRDQLEKAQQDGNALSFMKLAGAVTGVRDLSARKDFSRS